MNFISLFAGIGGFDLGLERAGMTCIAQVERDPYCLQVLAKHWPNVPRFDDVRTFGKEKLPDATVDLICGGSPCQPHSLAGKRKGAEDDRELWGEFSRVIGEFKPRWVLAENVPGLLSSNKGRFFGGILRDLARMGYDAEWASLQACAVGAPHTRARVFLVGYARHVLVQSGPNEAEYLGGETRKAPSGRESRIFRSSPYPGCETGRSSWEAEPSVGRVVDGVPHRLDRLRSLGNALVPQVAELAGRLIVSQQGSGN